MSASPSAGWRSSLGTGGKWLAGVIVVALVGAVVGILVPRLFGPPEVAASLSRPSVQADMTLEEYEIRHTDPRSARQTDDQAGVGSPPGAMVLISAATESDVAQEAVAADAGDEGEATTTSGETSEGTHTSTTGAKTTTTGDRTTTTGEQTTTTGGAKTTTTGGATTTTDGDTISADDVVVTPKLDEDEREELSDGVARALMSANAPLSIPPDCLENAISDSCGLNSVATAMDVAESGEVNRQTVARELARVFKGTRTAPSESHGGKRELVGAAVTFNVELTGFRGSDVLVKWSLYKARQNVRVPRPWLFDQRILRLTGKADKVRVSRPFWVPIPKRKGPFFIRVGVYDEDGGGLDYADTKSFR